jgi:nitrous oxidase accessory protein NosD
LRLSGAGIALGSSSIGGDTSRDNAVIGNVMVGRGISIFESKQVRVLDNSITKSVVGINVWQSTLDAFERNVMSGNEFGATMYEVTGRVRRNVANDNARSGFDIARSHFASGFERNIANGNGLHGVFAWDSHGRYIDNKTNANGGAGLLLTDGLPGHGQFFTVAGNKANANTLVGISTPTGTIDGGANKAHGNGDPLQCANVACR